MCIKKSTIKLEENPAIVKKFQLNDMSTVIMFHYVCLIIEYIQLVPSDFSLLTTSLIAQGESLTGHAVYH